MAKSLITRRQVQVLQEMAAAEDREAFEDAEIVCDRGVCYLGDTRIAKRTVFALLRLCLVRDETEGTGHLERYSINEHGRKLEPPAVILRDLKQRIARDLKRRIANA